MPYKKGFSINGEFFIKFVGESSFDSIMYYVQFVSNDKKSIVTLIDVMSGKIIKTKDI